MLLKPGLVVVVVVKRLLEGGDERAGVVGVGGDDGKLSCVS